MQESTKVKVAVLRDFTTAVFRRLGMTADDAAVSADVLLAADQRGIGSHGLQRLKRYVQELQAGSIKARADIKIIQETPNTALISGSDGMGFAIAHRAMSLVIEKALKNNVGMAAVRDSNHYGIAGYYAMMALPHDLIGVSLTNTTPSMAPTFGTDVILGTNPLAIAIPAGEERPVVLDMATTIVTAGKMELYRRESKKMPHDWAQDGTGKPDYDAARVIDNMLKRKKGGLLPLGGMGEDGAGYKGYGLSFIVDILCGVLAGSKYGADLYSVVDGRSLNKVSHFFAAIKIGAFIEPAVFKGLLDEYIRRLKSSRKAPGLERIFIHGEKEWETFERQQTEVPILNEVVGELRSIGREMKIETAF